MNTLPIITIDEFDRVTDSRAKTLIADTLKNISDEGLDVTIIIVGVAESVSDLILEHQSISRALVQIRMPRMSTYELREIVAARLRRTPLSISDDAIWEIAVLSRGLPWYTHSLGRFAARRAIEARTLEIDGRHVEKAVKDCLVDIDQTTKECYIHAITSTKHDNIYEEVLLACALTDCDELGRFTMKQVEEPLFVITGVERGASSFAWHLNEFCKTSRGPVLEKLQQRSQVKFRFVDPLMQPYVVLRGVDAGLITRSDAERFMSQYQPRFSIDV